MKFKLKKFLTKKRIIWGAIILIVILSIWSLFFGKKGNLSGTQTAIVSKQDLKQTVLTTGQVVSGIDLKLSFQGSGVVRQLLVQEGDTVSAGRLLAALDTSTARANLTTAQGSLAQAQANYEKLLAGASTEDIKTIENTVVSAQQDLDSSYSSSLNTLNDAYTKIYNALSTVITIQNTYFGTADQEGIKVQENRAVIANNMATAKSYLDTAKSNSTPANTDSAVFKMVIALNDTSDALKIIRDTCDQGAYYSKVSSTDKTSIDTQRTYINTGLTNTTSAQDDILSYKIALQEAQDKLALKIAPPRQADIDVALAQVTSAQGQVDAAKASLNNLIIIAPSSGTITLVDTKIGQQATAGVVVIGLQNVSDLHTEANVSEANIASLEMGQLVDYTFDALGPDEHFTGKVMTINPASTVISGVVNYKVTGSLDNIPKIKPGMTANMTILVAEKQGVLAVPSTAIVNKANGQRYVKIIDDKKTKKYHEVQVQIGLQADGGLVEILSGLSEGQEIITYMK